MTRTLGDITNELKEKVLTPAKDEAERIVAGLLSFKSRRHNSGCKKELYK